MSSDMKIYNACDHTFTQEDRQFKTWSAKIHKWETNVAQTDVQSTVTALSLKIERQEHREP